MSEYVKKLPPKDPTNHRIVRQIYGKAPACGGKFYDKGVRDYVTQADIIDFIQADERVEITDQGTGRDLTREILFRIIADNPRLYPSVSDLKAMIRAYYIAPERTCSCTCHDGKGGTSA